MELGWPQTLFACREDRLLTEEIKAGFLHGAPKLSRFDTMEEANPAGFVFKLVLT
jgi:hypothetical protein